ncbi:MAG: glutaredoxin domain-containing protein [Patescibacteria group bacterium]
MNKKVTIYTTPTCTYCRMSKAFFRENNIAYDEFDVQSDLVKRQEMVDKSGQLGVPVIVVADVTTGKEEIVIGFDRPELTRLLINK